MTDDATVDAQGLGPEPREHEHGPYCALCGQCKACTDRGDQTDYGCYDNEMVPRGTHTWNRS